MNKTLISFARKLRHVLGPILQMYGPRRVIYNLNLIPGSEQKRVALVYIAGAHAEFEHFKTIKHPNRLQHYYILKSLIDLNCVIDVYPCERGDVPYNFCNEKDHYDYIIGSGEEYLQLCQLNPKAQKILYITENAPWVVKKNYEERVVYYKQRHGKIIKNYRRDGFYTDEMYTVSDVGIAMSGSYNVQCMRELLPNINRVNVNALPAPSYQIGTKDFSYCRNRFVWFGSIGLIHKGLDILIDAFRELPDCHLDIYGAKPVEIDQIKLPENVENHGFMTVNSEDFIRKVVRNNAFVISLSCSEGMMSGVATCMMYGLIPVATIETGYDDCPQTITIKDWHVEAVKDEIRKIISVDEEVLQSLEAETYKYARSHYPNEYFGESIRGILNNIIRD